jgi:hypothetical protein
LNLGDVVSAIKQLRKEGDYEAYDEFHVTKIEYTGGLDGGVVVSDEKGNKYDKKHLRLVRRDEDGIVWTQVAVVFSFYFIMVICAINWDRIVASGAKSYRKSYQFTIYIWPPMMWSTWSLIYLVRFFLFISVLVLVSILGLDIVLVLVLASISISISVLLSVSLLDLVFDSFSVSVSVVC